MPTREPSEQGVLDASHTQLTQTDQSNIAGPSRHTSSTISTRSQRRSPGGSNTPLTPEESPPFRATRKRSAGIVQEEDKGLDDSSATPAHTRANSGDPALHVCICQPDPKIPRPRNAFILYRQHHQSNVVAQNPGLANPDISRIIGDQWNKLPPEVKNEWKALGEDEKIRHQQQYPDYRYQPKRAGRRNSHSDRAIPGGDKAKCAKCGGRSLIAPSTPHASGASNAASPLSIPPTPGSASGPTPVSRTLPVLRDLNLQSPATSGLGRSISTRMLAHQNSYEERDELGPLSAESKRRKYNGDQPMTVSRIMPPRYRGVPSGAFVGPGTPFPFGQPPPPFAMTGASHVRRESLPGLRGVVGSAGHMAPLPAPPRPGMGYQQHRMSQGHIPHDRSLVLPPLQTGAVSGPSGTVATSTVGMTAEEQIMSISFRYKVKILSQVANPASVGMSSFRGPLIAIEGDNSEAVVQLGKWLSEELGKGGGLSVRLLDGPDVAANADKKPMAQYHLLATEWLAQSDEMQAAMAYSSSDSTMIDVPPSDTKRSSIREIDEDYNDSDSSSKEDSSNQNDQDEHHAGSQAENIDINKTPSSAPKSAVLPNNVKPVIIIANYSLHASNVFACRIPIVSNDPYSPSDHWQWTATQWRGIIGPDLTIFLRDSAASETGKPTVEMLEEGNLFVVKRTQGSSQQGLELEASALRRLGFEVSEWVRGFGSEEKGSA